MRIASFSQYVPRDVAIKRASFAVRFSKLALVEPRIEVDPGGRKPRRDTFPIGRGSLVERQHQDAARGDEPAADGAGARHG